MANQTEKELRFTRKRFAQFCAVVTDYLTQLDAVMKQPESNQRGRKVAKLSNDLEMAKDSALHFDLDVPFPRHGRRDGASVVRAEARAWRQVREALCQSAKEPTHG